MNELRFLKDYLMLIAGTFINCHIKIITMILSNLNILILYIKYTYKLNFKDYFNEANKGIIAKILLLRIKY